MFELGLREWPQPQQLDASGERLLHLARGQDVRRPGEQEPAGCLIAVNDPLDREDQIGHSLDLVDEHRALEPSEEPGWIGLRGLAGALVVHAHGRRRVLALGDRLA